MLSSQSFGFTVYYRGFVKVSQTASPGHNYLSNDQSTNSSNISKVVQHSGLIMTICWISKVNNFSWPQWKACVGGWLKAGVNIVILTWCVPNGELYVSLIIFHNLLYFIKPCRIVDLKMSKKLIINSVTFCLTLAWNIHCICFDVWVVNCWLVCVKVTKHGNKLYTGVFIFYRSEPETRVYVCK